MTSQANYQDPPYSERANQSTNSNVYFGRQTTPSPERYYPKQKNEGVPYSERAGSDSEYTNESGEISLDEGAERNVGNFYPNNPPPSTRDSETNQFIVDQVTNVPDVPPPLPRGTVFSNRGQVIGVGVNQKAVIFSRGSVIDSDFLEARRNSKENADLASTYAAEDANDIFNEIMEVADEDDRYLDNRILRSLEKSRLDDHAGEISDQRQSSPKDVFKRHSHTRSFLLIRDTYIPFYENPTIEIKHGTDFSTIPVLGSLPIILFRSFQQKTIRITLKFNVPHIAEVLRTEGYELNDLVNSQKGPTSNDLKNGFFPNFTKTNSSVTPEQNNVEILKQRTKIFSEYKQNFRRISPLYEIKSYPYSLFGAVGNVLYNSNIEIGGSLISGALLNLTNSSSSSSRNYFLTAQSKVMRYIEAIRNASLDNTGDFNSATGSVNQLVADTANVNPSLPTLPTQQKTADKVTINYGPFFLNADFNLVGYDIKESQNKTYDVNTLMCNNYEVTLNLIG